MPKISVVLPTYNGERFLAQSIESVINQSFTDWEMIIVNDCSTDSTPAIIQEFVKLDSRIKVINNLTNKKLPGALNIGFEAAKGEYYTWTSDDNYYYPNALAEMNEFLDNYSKIPMVCAGEDIIDEKEHIISNGPRFDKEAMLFQNCLGACFLYRKSVVDRIGEYNVEKFLVEDYDYWLRILSTYGEIGYIDKKLYAYRMQDGSLTANRTKEIKKRTLMLLNEIWTDYPDVCISRKDLLFRIYYECIRCNMLSEKIENLARRDIPELAGFQKELCGDPIYLYGAGQYGDYAFDYFDGNIAGFIDGSDKKIGLTKNGKKIISVNDYLEKNNGQIVVTVHSSHLFEVVQDIYSKGIKKYTICQMLDEEIFR